MMKLYQTQKITSSSLTLGQTGLVNRRRNWNVLGKIFAFCVSELDTEKEDVSITIKTNTGLLAFFF